MKAEFSVALRIYANTKELKKDQVESILKIKETQNRYDISCDEDEGFYVIRFAKFKKPTSDLMKIEPIFNDITRWLEKYNRNTFDRLRRNGLKVDLYIYSKNVASIIIPSKFLYLLGSFRIFIYKM